MRDSQHDGQAGGEGEADGVSRFAAAVVARLISRDERTAAAERAMIVGKLRDAVLSSDRLAFDALRPELRRARLSAAILADEIIPEVARSVGCDWMEDRLSFADVTIASARLQGILRSIGAEWFSDQADSSRPDTVLVIVPDGEQHTLGAMVLTGQLRRRGLSVCLRIGLERETLAHLLRDRRFGGALISFASAQRLASCRGLVDCIRQSAHPRIPVIIGGAVLDLVEEVATKTGADVATNDLAKALAALNLTFFSGELELGNVS
ncbi:MAG: cobalamin B12-binding domain-containing protein [Tabrizicola sp.]|nr:cobalamin B12-binding domain-containing protein [Tabrizicola sp.]